MSGRRGSDSHSDTSRDMSPGEREASPKRSASPAREASRSRSRSRSRPKDSPPRDSGRRSRSRSRSRDRRRSRSRERRYRSRSRSAGHRRRHSRSRSPYRGGGRRGRSRSTSPMSSRRRHTGNRDNPRANRCCGVFGLSLYTQERDLRDAFTRYGPIEDLQIVYDHQTGRSRGFAFIYFRNEEDAFECKEHAPGMEIDGRKIRIDFSITERAHTPTPGIYLGKPTSRYNRRDRRSPSPYYDRRDRGGDRGYGRDRGRDYGRSRHSRSRSRSYSPRRY